MGYFYHNAAYLLNPTPVFMDFIHYRDLCMLNISSAPVEYLYHVVKYFQSSSLALKKCIDYGVVSFLNNTLCSHSGSASLSNSTTLMKYHYHHHMWLLSHLMVMQVNPTWVQSIYPLKIFLRLPVVWTHLIFSLYDFCISDLLIGPLEFI